MHPITGCQGGEISITLSPYFPSSGRFRERWGCPSAYFSTVVRLPLTGSYLSKSSFRNVHLQQAPPWPWLFHHPDLLLSISAVAQLLVDISWWPICSGPSMTSWLWLVFFLTIFYSFAMVFFGERLSYAKLKAEKSQMKVFKLLAADIQLLQV